MSVLRIAALSGLVRPSSVVLIEAQDRGFPRKEVRALGFTGFFASLFVRRRRQGRDEGARFGLHFEGEYWPGGRQVRFTLSWLSSYWSVKCLMPRRLAVILLQFFTSESPLRMRSNCYLCCAVNQHLF